jgi:hypothetical protein
MITLYYPAVLGTCVVLLLLRITLERNLSEAVKDIALYFGLVTIMYFSASFLVIDAFKSKDYGVMLFLLDTVEMIIIFLAFFALGLFKTESIVEMHLSAFYYLFALLIILQNVWNYFAGFKDNVLIVVAVIGLIVTLIGGFIGYQYLAFNITVLLLTVAGIIWSLVNFRWDSL